MAAQNDSIKVDPELPPQQAIPRLLELHGDRLYGLGLRLCDTPEQARDLVQETFLRAFRSWDQFEGRADPGTWLYAIASNTCKRLNRRRAGEPRHLEPLEELLPARGEPVLASENPEGEPEAELRRREAHRIVSSALHELPIEYRLPLVLKDIAELSVSEVGQILGLKQATVKTRVHRGRLKLRQALEQNLPRVSLPEHDHSRRVCLDLLKAKQEALDRGAPFPFSRDELCVRCRALLRSLDLAHDACHELAGDHMPAEIRELIEQETGNDSR
jgi:RNA polymerase sigma-70 factor (ECF subfamily)